jgi:hypothetical protein
VRGGQGKPDPHTGRKGKVQNGMINLSRIVI